MEKSDIIIAWIKEHDAINISALSRLVKWNHTSLQKAMQGIRKIPKDKIKIFEKILKSYGYEPNRD